jgi:hypothetical protein
MDECEILKARFAPSSVMVFVSNPFEPVTLFQQQKIVTRKCRSLQKFLTAKNGLFLGANRVVVSNILFRPNVNALT